MNERVISHENASAEIDELVIRDLGGDVAHIRQSLEISHDLRDVAADLVDALENKPDLVALALLTALNAGVSLQVPAASAHAFESSMRTAHMSDKPPLDANIEYSDGNLVNRIIPGTSALAESFPGAINAADAQPAQDEKNAADAQPAPDEKNATDEQISTDDQELSDAKRESRAHKQESAPSDQDIQDKYFAELGFIEKNPYEALIDKIFGAVSPEIARDAKEVLRYYDPVTGKVTKENANFDPLATNKNADGSVDRGLYQVNDMHTLSDLLNRFPEIADNLGITSPDALFDPETNIKVALWVMWQFHGWRAWYGAPDHLREKPRYDFTDEQLATIHDILYGFHYDPVPTEQVVTP